MTNIEMVQNLNALGALLEAEKKANTQRLTPRVYYAVKRNMGVLGTCYQPYIEALSALQKKYKKEDGEVDENNVDYQKELKDLLIVENKDIVIHGIRLADMEACKDLTYAEQEALYFMIAD